MDRSMIPASVDVAIIGAGPAGLSAAAELRRLGVGSVLVLEREAEAGGVPRYCGHSPYGFREFRRPMFGPAYAKALWQRAVGAGAEVRTSAAVTALQPGPRLQVTSDDGVSEIKARAVLVVTGVREQSRAGRLIGGTKPGGVMTTGALQGLVHGAGMRPFHRPVILGTELVSFSAILTCRHAGIRPVAMVEPGGRIVARHPSQMLPRMMGIPLHLGTELVEIVGRDRVEGVVLDRSGKRSVLETDGVIVTGRFRPESTLARSGGLRIDALTGGPEIDDCGRCSVPGYYAAGNVLRPVETAGWCWEEGRAVARAIARDLTAETRPGSAPVEIMGDALKYVVPQRLGGDGKGAHERFQIRVGRPVKGRLSLRVNGHEVAGHSLSALPERRVFLPLPPGGNRVSVVFEESD